MNKLVPNMRGLPARGFLCALALALAGCTAAEQKPTIIQPVTQPMAYREPAPTYSNPGSIFSESDALLLFDDHRAKRVGDIVMVNVVESASAANEATTDTNRDSNSEYGVSALFGRSSIPLVDGKVGSTPILGTNTKKEFSADGSTTRNNRVTATVAARVVNVLPDGLLRIEGARETKVNNETQFLVVAGLIRSRDVAADNSVLSTQMADAHISYYGEGVIADKQKPGWLTRLLDNIWPF